MALYARQSGDTNYTVRTARFFREETRKWYLNVSSVIASVITVNVYDDLAAATAKDGSNAAAGTATGVSGTGTFSVSLTNTSNPPTFTNATVDVEVTTALAGGEEAVWEVDLGPKMERSILRVLRGFDTYVDGASDYAHNLDTVELGAMIWDEVDADADKAFPYVGLMLANVPEPETELGTGVGGNLRYDLVLECIAHNSLTVDDRTVDANGLWLFHDLRRALTDLEGETYTGSGATGDGVPYRSASIRIAESNPLLSWFADRVTLVFEVVLTIEELRSEVTAG